MPGGHREWCGRRAGHSLVSCRTMAGLRARHLPEVALEDQAMRGHGQMRGGEAGGRGGGE